jgi:Protein of unknown function (DUF1203)
MARAALHVRKNREAPILRLRQHAHMNYRIQGLQRSNFAHLTDQAPDVLQRSGVQRITVDSSPGYPDRITLDDVPAGQTVLLLNYTHQPANTPFHASHAIYVRERGGETFDQVNTIPPALARRLIALRAFDARDHMIDADIAPGTGLPALIERMLANPEARYLHAHYAKWGCYAARVDRA